MNREIVNYGIRFDGFEGVEVGVADNRDLIVIIAFKTKRDGKYSKQKNKKTLDMSSGGRIDDLTFRFVNLHPDKISEMEVCAEKTAGNSRRVISLRNIWSDFD